MDPTTSIVYMYATTFSMSFSSEAVSGRAMKKFIVENNVDFLIKYAGVIHFC